jgi:quercetin dioxygenase-like cupin family protein
MEEKRIIHNVPVKTPVAAVSLIKTEEGGIISKILAQNPAVSITLFSFSKGQEISEHESEGDAFVQVLEGTGTFRIDGTEYAVKAGDCLLMPHDHPHAVLAREDFKMLLTVVF